MPLPPLIVVPPKEKVDLGGVSFAVAEKHHYPRVGKDVAANLEREYGKPVDWASASGRQSCALRLSIALVWAGVKFPPTKYTWRHKKRDQSFPVQADDYLDLLGGSVVLKGTPAKRKQAISGQKGVVFFGPFENATGHVTLWDGKETHFRFERDYWGQSKVVFWRMRE